MRRRAWAGAGLLGFAIAVALVARVWTPWDAGAIDVGHRLLPGSIAHPLGTDQLGRDLLSMLMAGAGPPLGTAMLATLIGALIGGPLGLIAAARPGLADDVVTRTGDVLFAFPALVLALLLVAVLGPGVLPVALAVGLVNIPVFVRVARAAARAVLVRDFVAAARTAGLGEGAVARAHVLPNIASALAVQAAIQFSVGLLAEAGLAFLGLGAQPPEPSWGRMIADAQTLIGSHPRLVVWPGLCITLAVLSANLLADGLRRRGRA